MAKSEGYVPQHERYVLDGQRAFEAAGICCGEEECGDCRRCPYFEFQNGWIQECVRRMAGDCRQRMVDQNKEIYALKKEVESQRQTIKSLYRQLTTETERKNER